MASLKQRSSMSASEFSRRCRKLFGKDWVYDVAFNFGQTRQNIEQIRDGKHRVKHSLRMIIEGWETGRIPFVHRPKPRIGRPPKNA